MPSSLLFKIKSGDAGQQRVIRMFFDAWVDDMCSMTDEILSTVTQTAPDSQLYQLTFKEQEDAIAVALACMPAQLLPHIELLYT